MQNTCSVRTDDILLRCKHGIQIVSVFIQYFKILEGDFSVLRCLQHHSRSACNYLSKIHNCFPGRCCNYLHCRNQFDRSDWRHCLYAQELVSVFFPFNRISSGIPDSVILFFSLIQIRIDDILQAAGFCAIRCNSLHRAVFVSDFHLI